MPGDAGAWLASVTRERFTLWAKRLSANDTGQTGGHQVGPYVPKSLVEDIQPNLLRSDKLNPRAEFVATFDSHAGYEVRELQLIYYNNRIVADGTRNECRLTNWGGRAAPLQQDEATGSLCAFAFRLRDGPSIGECRIWLCVSLEEEEAIENQLGPVEPGVGTFIAPGLPSPHEKRTDCWLKPGEIPAQWKRQFPSPEDIIERALRKHPCIDERADKRLIERRRCEEDIFMSIEEIHVLPRIERAFQSVDEFMTYAGSVANRRKSRSGKSLELHLDTIFREERLPFDHGAESENGKRPDFLFPSASAYRNPKFPANRLRMLAAKTTCKDRWRQVIDEAKRIPVKHLLTLQEGVSVSQFRQMVDAGVQLVVPSPYVTKYPQSLRSNLLTLTGFIRKCRALNRSQSGL